jgi:hypothetical protein
MNGVACAKQRGKFARFTKKSIKTCLLTIAILLVFNAYAVLKKTLFYR